MLRSRLSSIVTDGAIDRLGAFGCILFLCLDAQFKPIRSIVLLCGVVSICRSLTLFSTLLLGSGLFFNAKGAEGFWGFNWVVGGCRKGRKGGMIVLG